MWEAAPCSTLPTADENAVTTVSSSLFQLEAVLTENELLYCSVLLPVIFRPQVFWISCLAMVVSESQLLRWLGVFSCSFCLLASGSLRHGLDVAHIYLVESCQPLLLQGFLQWWQVQLLGHVSHASHLSRCVVPLDEVGCLALYHLQWVHILLQVWIPYCCAVFQRGPDQSDVC